MKGKRITSIIIFAQIFFCHNLKANDLDTASRHYKKIIDTIEMDAYVISCESIQDIDTPNIDHVSMRYIVLPSELNAVLNNLNNNVLYNLESGRDSIYLLSNGAEFSEFNSNFWSQKPLESYYYQIDPSKELYFYKDLKYYYSLTKFSAKFIVIRINRRAIQSFEGPYKFNFKQPGQINVLVTQEFTSSTSYTKCIDPINPAIPQTKTYKKQ